MCCAYCFWEEWIKTREGKDRKWAHPARAVSVSRHEVKDVRVIRVARSRTGARQVDVDGMGIVELCPCMACSRGMRFGCSWVPTVPRREGYHDNDTFRMYLTLPWTAAFDMCVPPLRMVLSGEQEVKQRMELTVSVCAVPRRTVGPLHQYLALDS